MNKPEGIIRKELEELVNLGGNILFSEMKISAPKEFEKHNKDKIFKPVRVHASYQKSYDRTVGLVRSLAPERWEEFRRQYEPDPRRKDTSYSNYTIYDYLQGTVVLRGGSPLFNNFTVFVTKIQHQILMLESILDTFADRIRDIREVLRSELFDAELETSEELLKKSHLRAAGTVAGVVLERHLQTICAARNIPFRKKHPTIADYNDALRKSDAYDVPAWRFIQRLGDLRNLCAHPKERDPTKGEIQDLIIGTRKTIAEIS